MKIIIGLGNPGTKYLKTRHNVGFIILNKLQHDLNKQKYDFSKFSLEKKHNAEISEGKIGNEKVLLVKPRTFMNESGQSAQSIIHFYKVDPEKDLLIIYDDIDLPTGEVRTTGTSSGGHKGMQSIIASLGTENISRIRIGILGKPKDEIENTSDYVLKNFSRKEFKSIEVSFFGVCSVIKEFIKK